MNWGLPEALDSRGTPNFPLVSSTPRSANLGPTPFTHVVLRGTQPLNDLLAVEEHAPVWLVIGRGGTHLNPLVDHPA